jgi:hypothetical protein
VAAAGFVLGVSGLFFLAAPAWRAAKLPAGRAQGIFFRLPEKILRASRSRKPRKNSSSLHQNSLSQQVGSHGPPDAVFLPGGL